MIVNISVIALMLSLAIFPSGCSMLPNSYKSIQTDVWKSVDIDNTEVSVDLPVDKDMPWQPYSKDGVHTISLPFTEITPNSLLEPLTFSDIEITVLDLKSNPKNHWDLLVFDGEEKNKVYRYVGMDNIYTICAIQIDQHLWVKVCHSIIRVKSLGYAFYKHDPSCADKINQINLKILWSLKYKGSRLLDVKRPEDITINKLNIGKPAKGYEDLFKEFGY